MSPPRIMVPPPPPPVAALEEPDVFIMDPSVGEIPAFISYKNSGDLQALSDASLTDWVWMVYRIRNADEMVRDRAKGVRVFVTKFSGPLDVMDVQRVCGGGVFEIRGFLNNRMLTCRRHELAGPIRTWTAPAANPDLPALIGAAAPAAVPDGGTRRLLRLLRRQQREQIELRAELRALRSTPAPSPAASGPSFTELFELADRMHQRTNPAPEAGMVDQVIGAFRSGMELKREVEGDPARSTTELVLEKGLPVIERLLGGFLASRGGARRPAPHRSSAAIVSDPPAAVPPANPPAPGPPAPGGQGDDEGAHRWQTAVDAMVRAMRDRVAPSDFAADLEAILLEDELRLLEVLPPASVLDNLRERAGGRFPELLEPGAETFLRGVIAELKNPTGDDDEVDADGGPVPGL